MAQTRPNRREWTKADISQHFIFRSRSLLQPYQSVHPSGYYDASLGRGYERATISMRSGGAAASWPTVAGAKHPLKIIGFLGAGGAYAWIPMVASFEQRLTQSRC